MTGGLMQLVALGAQDIYLTGNPVITYFKSVYRRHTNFAMESIQQTFNGPVNFGSTVTSLISRSGDLLTGIYLQSTLPDIISTGITSDNQRWTDNLGHYLIKEVWIEIGGQKIDHHYGDWLEIWSQLTVPAGQMIGYLEMIGQDPRNPLQMNTGLQRDIGPGSIIPGRTIFVPLQFWFCRNVGLSLPLISLQYSEVKIHLTLSKFSEMVVNTGSATLDSGDLIDTNIWADYIYLDTDERRRFAQVSHEYLIEQLQYVNERIEGTSTTADIILNFNHPVKEIIWVGRFLSATNNGVNQWANYTTVPSPYHTSLTTDIITGPTSTTFNLGHINTHDSIETRTDATNIVALTNHSYIRPYNASNNIDKATLYLNGNARFKKRKGLYFNWVQCNEHHTNIPASPGINVYSFAYKPEWHQPSGTCNFSRLIEARLSLELNEGKSLDQGFGLSFVGSARTIKVYAVNYNILRIMSGLAGVAYPQ